MIGRTTWTLLMIGALVASTGAAVAQFSDHHFFDDDFGIDEDILLAHGPCNGGDGVDNVADTSRRAFVEETREQNVDVDEDDVLLAIALANNGASDIDWNDIRDWDLTHEMERTASQTADLEREDVFSALALGVSASGGALETLVCVSDIELTERMSRTASREVDLDEDTVLLAIALSNSIGSSLEFNDIASISESDRAEIEQTRTVDVDRDDAFLALALGAGGT